ncbi:MAG: S9 family peptidase [Dysgonamonadaceae bacterium]|jgi:dipeptidyl-peptidase-4|nr:S9 family peptidase [Dysgonamonadaceae bacterium]
MNYFIYLLIFLSVPMNIYAQEKQFTLEDLIPGGNSYSLVPKTEYRVKWKGDSLVFSNDTASFIAAPARPDKRTPFAEEARGTAKEGWENTDYCGENGSVAYTVGNGLYIADKEGRTWVVAEEDSTRDIVYGKAAHRNEFGIEKGTFWSPGGRFLAFYRLDESLVADYPLVDISAREAALKSIKYPMAGRESQQVTVGIYSLASKETVYLKTGEPEDRYLTNLSWDPGEQSVYIAELNRAQNHLQLNRYSVETGERTQLLLEERHEKYVEPQTPLLFLKRTPGRFIRQSAKDGYNHLYLYNTEGKLLKQLTSGEYTVGQVLGLDRAENQVFFVSNESNPLEFQVYKVHLKSGKKTQLTFAPGVHRPQLSASGNYLLDYYSNRDTPLHIDLVSTGNARTQRLQSAANPLAGYALPEICTGSLKAADGESDLYYRLTKPVGFEATKKYPTIVYVYGGPHSQLVVHSWLDAARGWEIYMAQKGYVVFTMDNRGTSNRGLAFEHVIHRRLGVHETDDQLCGIEFLRSLPYVDAERIGVHGWSYGGFMTLNLMLRHPGTFKVGVAGGPVVDWKYYEVMYGERYMSRPQENPEGYEECNMNRYAGRLDGRLLLIHGDEDPTVVWQNSLSFLKACIAAGTYPDYFVYPGQGHNMRGRDRVHLHEKITRYFDDFLK